MNNNFLPYQLKKTNDTNEALATQLAQNTSYMTWNAINVKSPIGTGLTAAKGDWNGTTGTDDTTALQALINYAITNGRALYFPAGTYLISATLNINTTSNGFTIKGDGRKLSTIKINTDNTILSTSQGIPQNVLIQDIGFIGKQGATNAVPVLNLKPVSTYQYSTKIKVDNVNIQYGYDGIWLDQCIVSEFKMINIDTPAHNGFTTGGGQNYFTSTSFTECYVVNPGNNGYDITVIEYTSFNNCACDGAGGNPYNIRGGYGVTFNSCDCESYVGIGYNIVPFVSGSTVYSLSKLTFLGCNITSAAAANSAIYINSASITVELINTYINYTSAAAQNPVYITTPNATTGVATGSTNGNQKIVQIGGYIYNGGGLAVSNDMTRWLSMGSLNSSALGYGVGAFPVYGFDNSDNSNIKAHFGISGTMDSYIKINSNQTFGLSNSSDPTKTGVINFARYSRDGQLSITGSGLQVGTGIYSNCATFDAMLYGTTNWNPGTIAAGAMMSATVSVTNAVIGNQVACGFTQVLPAGILLTGQVTAAGTITVTLYNASGSSQTIASGTVNVTVFKTV